MRIDILTLFPNMFGGPFAESIIKRAMERNLVSITIHNLRDWGIGKHKIVDDYPFGGGTGMVLKPEPLFEAAEAIKAESANSSAIISRVGKRVELRLCESRLPLFSMFLSISMPQMTPAIKTTISETMIQSL